jgi:hypothetical protein
VNGLAGHAGRRLREWHAEQHFGRVFGDGEVYALRGRVSTASFARECGTRMPRAPDAARRQLIAVDRRDASSFCERASIGSATAASTARTASAAATALSIHECRICNRVSTARRRRRLTSRRTGGRSWRRLRRLKDDELPTNLLRRE